MAVVSENFFFNFYDKETCKKRILNVIACTRERSDPVVHLGHESRVPTRRRGGHTHTEWTGTAKAVLLLNCSV